MQSNLKTLTFLFCFVIMAHYSSFSQTQATTIKGDTVYLYDNGTWSFELQESPTTVSDGLEYLTEVIKIDTVDQKFKKPKNARKELTNEWDMFRIHYDDSLWERVPPATLNEEAEFALKSKTTDIWSVVISEETPVDMDALFKIAKNTMSDEMEQEPKLIRTEIKNVNGVQILHGTMEVKFSGILLIFDSYYFSNPKGSVQFITWSSTTIWKKNKALIEDLLNGFIAL